MQEILELILELLRRIIEALLDLFTWYLILKSPFPLMKAQKNGQLRSGRQDFKFSNISQQDSTILSVYAKYKLKR